MALKTENTESSRQADVQAIGEYARNNPLLSAVRDDGTPEGVIKTAQKNGNLIRIPASRIDWNSAGSVNSGTVSRRTNYTQNKDSSNSAITLTTFSATDCAVCNITFYGPSCALSIRMSTNTNQVTPEFSALINGKTYAIGRDRIFRYNVNRPVSGEFNDGIILIDRNLPEGENTLQVVLTGGATSKSMVIYGLYVEEGYGYNYGSAKNVDSLFAGGFVPAALTNVPLTNNAGIEAPIKQLRYSNLDTNPVTLTWEYGTQVSPAIQKITDQIVIPAGGRHVMDFGPNGVYASPPTQSNTNGLQHIASVANKVACTVIFGQP